MEDPDQLQSKTSGELEEWFLEALESTPLPMGDMLRVLRRVAQGEPSRAEEWAELLQEAVSARGDEAGCLDLLKLRLDWQTDTASFAGVCRDAVSATFKSRLGRAFAGSVDSDSELPAREILRRLATLLALEEGVLCRDKTWGFGVVRRVDDFYRKVRIDFESKPSHELSLAYAAETLELLDENHLLTRRHRDPAALERLVQEDAAEVVRIAIRSFGPLSAPLLKEHLVDGILPESDWKRFWDSARKDLKADPLVELPARRNDPIRLLAREKQYDDGWFSRLSAERDIEQILTSVTEVSETRVLSELPDPLKRIVDERLAFVVSGSESRSPDLTARALLAAAALGLEGGELDVPDVTFRLLPPENLLRVLATVPAKVVAPLIAHFNTHAPEKTAGGLVALLPRLPLNVLNAATDFLLGGDHADACLDVFRDRLSSRQAGPAMLYWCCRHISTVCDRELVMLGDLMIQMVDCLAESFSGEELKARNQLYALFSQKAWFEDVTSRMTPRERQGLFVKIKAMRGWDVTEQRSAMARLIRAHPALENLVAGEEVDANGESGPRGRFTSLRMHRERRGQLRKLIEHEIPENSREIGVARSYGDLRENAEYKFAREYQGILMRRKAELEHDLAEIKATDFAGFSTETAGVGTTVTVERPGGVLVKTTILGEWDRDESLRIVSSSSRLAQALEGRKPGDELQLPGADGDETCRIVDISAPGPEIKAWIAGD